MNTSRIGNHTRLMPSLLKMIKHTHTTTYITSKPCSPILFLLDYNNQSRTSLATIYCPKPRNGNLCVYFPYLILCTWTVRRVPVCIRRHTYGVQWIHLPGTPTSHYNSKRIACVLCCSTGPADCWLQRSAFYVPVYSGSFV